MKFWTVVGFCVALFVPLRGQTQGATQEQVLGSLQFLDVPLEFTEILLVEVKVPKKEVKGFGVVPYQAWVLMARQVQRLLWPRWLVTGAAGPPRARLDGSVWVTFTARQMPPGWEQR